MTKTADLTAPLLPTTPTNGTVPLDRDPRDPFTSLTNSTFATSRLPPSRASRSSLRQTSLFDAFPRPPSPASSSSPSSLPFDNNADASTSALSSPCATCPCAVNLGDGDRESGNVQVDAGEVGGVEIEVETEGSAPKRRRLRAAEEREEEDAPQVVARLDTRCDVRKVPSLFNAPGKQTSVFGAVNRRALGLPTSAAQGELALGPGRVSRAQLILAGAHSVDATDPGRLRVQQRAADLSLFLREELQELRSSFRSRFQQWCAPCERRWIVQLTPV